MLMITLSSALPRRFALSILGFLLGIISLPLFAKDTNAPPQGTSTPTNDTSKASNSKSATGSDTGTFTVSNLQIETDILANRSMRSIADKIGDSIIKSAPSSIAFYDDSGYQAVVQSVSYTHLILPTILRV